VRVAQWARRAGMNRHVHPHMFRHSCATHLLESSGQIRELAEFLGMRTCPRQRSTAHLNVQYLAKIYAAAHPRATHAKAAEMMQRAAQVAIQSNEETSGTKLPPHPPSRLQAKAGDATSPTNGPTRAVRGVPRSRAVRSGTARVLCVRAILRGTTVGAEPARGCYADAVRLTVLRVMVCRQVGPRLRRQSAR
jgi:hypothetical protein